jgi:regulator of sigma E protease
MDIPNIISTVVYFLLVLSVLVLVHEIGHFIFARRFGVRVEEFGLGYPPRALTLWRENGMIQIQSKKIRVPRKFVLPPAVQPGSWVVYKTAMENGREMLTAIDPIDQESRVPEGSGPSPSAAANAAPRGARAEGIVRSTAVGTAGSRVPAASQVQDLDRGTIYTLNWLPLGGFVRMTGEENPSDPRSFAAARPWKRAIILAAGAGMNVLLAIVVFTIIAMAGMSNPIELVSITAVSPGSPAEGAGLQPGDRLVTINGIPVQNRTDVTRAAFDLSGQPVTLELKRGKDNVTVTLTPRNKPPKNEGRIGITMAAQLLREETVSYPLWQAIPFGISRTFDTGGQIFTGFRRMVDGSAPVEVGGPVKIAQYTNLAAQLGFLTLMEFTALLSVNLAIINMFPFPALDGGRLVFVVLEALRRGKRVSPEKESLVHFVGMAILLIMMALITFSDIWGGG